jgi:hypothetical protein
MRIGLQTALAVVTLSTPRLDCADAEPGPRIFNTLARAEYEKNPALVVALLNEIQTLDIWSMGRGLGPSDRSSLTIYVLWASKPYFAWIVPAATGPASGLQPPLRDWVLAEPGTETAMLEMLSSPNPLGRWIALEKLKSLEVLSPVIASRLEEMAQNDDYIRISPVGPSGESNEPLPAGRAYDDQVFAVPLREAARRLLAKTGRPMSPIDENELCREGLIWLGMLYLAKAGDSIAQLSIQGALLRLAPVNAELAAAQKRADPPQTPEQLLALFRALAEGRSLASEASGAPPRREVRPGIGGKATGTIGGAPQADKQRSAVGTSGWFPPAMGAWEWLVRIAVVVTAGVAVVVVLIVLRAKHRARDDKKPDKA